MEELKDIYSIKEQINFQKVCFFFIGLVSSGKTSFLNNNLAELTGEKVNILPTSFSENTKWVLTIESIETI